MSAFDIQDFILDPCKTFASKRTALQSAKESQFANGFCEWLQLLEWRVSPRCGRSQRLGQRDLPSRLFGTVWRRSMCLLRERRDRSIQV